MGYARMLLAGLMSLAASSVAATDTVVVDASEAAADGNGVARISVSLQGTGVGGVAVDLLFDRSVILLPAASACRINPLISDRASICEEAVPPTAPCKTLLRDLVDCGVTPGAPGCAGEKGTTGRFRGLIAAIGIPNNNPIPDGAVLFTCDFQVIDPERLPAIVRITNVNASSPFGAPLPATGNAGSVEPPPLISPTPTRTASPTATDTPTPTWTPTTTRTPSPSPSPSATPRPARGDCSGDGEVTVDEILRGVAIALGTLDVSQCLAMDMNGDAAVTVDEILTALAEALGEG